MSLLRGTVIDNKDPMQRGRCRVYVWGMHKGEDPNLPWAETAGSTMFGLHKGVGYSGVLQVGTTVWVQFEQNDIQCPVIVGVFVGHDAETMAEVNPDNSDFHPDAKGDNYGKVWMFNTPEGNSFKMDDANPRIHITTPNGFELDLNDKDRTIRLGTPCGPEIVMECDGKLKISNGCTSITMDGCNPIVLDGDVLVNGHLTAQGVFAPNLCYCSSPGSKHTGTMKSQEKEQKAKQQRCNPTVDPDGKNSCGVDYMRNTDTSELDPKLIKVLQKAQEIYRRRHGQDYNLCETKMDAEKYQCLRSAGVDVPEQMVCGYGIQVKPYDASCDEEAPVTNSNNECGGKFASIENLKATIASGESTTMGGYNAYNCGDGCKGTIGKFNFANMTISEIMERFNRPMNPERIFVWGKYQMRGDDVTPAAVKWAKLSLSDKGTPENQEKMFGYFLVSKRSQITDYLTGSGSLSAAMLAMSREWASIGLYEPYGKRKKGESYYGGGNKAHTPPEVVVKDLEALKSEIAEVAESKGISKLKALQCMVKV